MTTTKQQDTDCSVFNCSGLYSTHSKCVKMAPDYQDVLQNHSINSLIANGVLKQQDQELLGLNSPRGLLGGSFGNYDDCQSTPIIKPVGFQYKLEKKIVNYASVASTPIKRNMSVNSSLNSSSTNWSNNSYRSPSISDSTLSSIPPNSPLRSTSLSDCSGSNSPSVFDSFYGGNLHFATESDNSAVSSPDGSLTEILNTLTLNDNFASSYLNRKADMMNMQHLHQENYTPNYFQKASPSYYGNSTNLHNVANANSRKILPANDAKFKPTHYEHTLEKWTGNHQNSNNHHNHRRYHQDKSHLDRVARFHRSAAQLCDAMCTWSGVLPENKNKSLGFSSKIFLGGVPWDISEHILVQTFREFGPIKVEWPGKEKQAMQPKGYVYIIFENEKNVKSLLQACTSKYSRNNNWYYKISSKRLRAKDIQVIPWFLSDTNYSKSISQKLDPSRTVFVGALHGMLNAEGLATIMNDLFDGVVYAGIDTDKYKYPIGSGRVTFNNSRSYMKAINAGFVEIKTARFTKTVQVDPYLEDALCSVCGVQQGPYFCRELTCFRYFCRGCWSWQHCFEYASHKPLMRNSKNSTILGLENSGNLKCIDY